jgi:hypothetical protein
MAAKVQSALSVDAGFAKRTVTVVGTGEMSQVQIVYDASEGDVNPILVETPVASSPTVSTKNPFQQVAEIQTMDFSSAPTNTTGSSVDVVLTDGSTTLTIPVAAGQNYADTIQAFLSNPTSAPTFAGRSVTADALVANKLVLQFGNT